MLTRVVIASLLSFGLVAGGALAQSSGSSGNSGSQGGNQADNQNSGNQGGNQTGGSDATGNQRGQSNNCLSQSDKSASNTSGTAGSTCN